MRLFCRNDQVVIKYGRKTPAEEWEGTPGRVVLQALGPGPRNVLVETERGPVVVPWSVLKKTSKSKWEGLM